MVYLGKVMCYPPSQLTWLHLVKLISPNFLNRRSFTVRSLREKASRISLEARPSHLGAVLVKQGHGQGLDLHLVVLL